jgi:hypothetical protein
MDSRDTGASQTLTGLPPDSTTERALRRIVAEIVDGLRHGHFAFSLTGEIIGQGRRRLTLHAGKSYQFIIPNDECETTDPSNLARTSVVEDA